MSSRRTPTRSPGHKISQRVLRRDVWKKRPHVRTTCRSDNYEKLEGINALDGKSICKSHHKLAQVQCLSELRPRSTHRSPFWRYVVRNLSGHELPFWGKLAQDRVPQRYAIVAQRCLLVERRSWIHLYTFQKFSSCAQVVLRYYKGQLGCQPAGRVRGLLHSSIAHRNADFLGGSIVPGERGSGIFARMDLGQALAPGMPATTTAPPEYPTGPYGISTSAAPYTSASSGPCASVSKLAASATAASPSATATVPAELAYQCLNSIPFNSSAAVAFLDALRPYVDWQTTITYLKDPPAEYVEKIQPPYDFYANYERIYENAINNAYSSEYEFGYEAYEAFLFAHDGHFVLYPDSVNEIFSFGRPTPLVSVSVDGTSIPEVFVYSDVLEASFGNGSAGFTPSQLVMIDGEDSTEWLMNYSQHGSLQDRDALWNNMFYILAQVSLGSGGTGTGTFSGGKLLNASLPVCLLTMNLLGGRGRWVYPGATTTLSFANGTNTTMENFARVLVPFDGINTGEDIYRSFFIPPNGQVEFAETNASTTAVAISTASMSSSSSSMAATTIPAPGYPSPLIREPANLNSGYFLDGADYDDIAVLSVPSFVGDSDEEVGFQVVNTYTINQAVKANKTKLIIDVSANSGGTILQGYDLFKQLFPQILPYGATRFRTHEAFDLIGQETSAYAGLVPRSLDTNDTVQELVASVFNYRTDTDINYEPFTSWLEKNGPHAYGPGPDNFTSIIRWNLSDVLTPDNSGGIDVSGYLNRSNITTQPFRSENIVIVYDGYCASTCTIFSELMRQQAGIRTIALGGRPTKDIIQAVGGVKGTNDFLFEDILSSVTTPFQTQLLNSASYYNTTALGRYSNLFSYRTVTAVVNARDGIREGDIDEVPLQFRYEPADCRIYYTPAMVVDQTAVWKTVADTAFNGISHCVAGELHSTSKEKRTGLVDGKVRVRHEQSPSGCIPKSTMRSIGGSTVPRSHDGFTADRSQECRSRALHAGLLEIPTKVRDHSSFIRYDSWIPDDVEEVALKP
nr:peptidase s41 family protein ustp [Quercus suber]